MIEGTYIVVCTDEGQYVLATRQTFGTREAAQEYAATCSESRRPLVVEGRWHQLRGPGAPRPMTPAEAAAWENAEANDHLSARDHGA